MSDKRKTVKRAAQSFAPSHRRKAWNKDATKKRTFDTNKMKELASSDLCSYYNQDEQLQEYLGKASKFLESSEEGEDDEFTETWGSEDEEWDSKGSAECSDSIQKSDIFSIVTMDMVQKISDDTAVCKSC